MRYSLGRPPWIDLDERRKRSTGAWRQCRCSWWNSPSSTALRKIAESQKAPAKENDSRASERVLKKLSNYSRPPHFRRPAMSNSIPFHSTLRTVPSLSSSPPFVLLPILLFTAVPIPHLSCASLSFSLPHPT